MANHYLAVKDHINQLATQYGRNPDSIALIAVTKGHPLSDLLPAYQDGCRDFGENRVQEALEKIEQAPADLRWHLIGTLQSNKINKVLGRFVLIHSVDYPELAKQIAVASSKQGITTEILLQVNTSGEATKHGLTMQQWEQHIEELLQYPSIRLRGLMTMGPLNGNEQTVRHCFASLRQFRDLLNSRYSGNLHLDHLSMGMSEDYPWAIAEGATLLRIGTAIFGPRPMNVEE